LYGIFSALAAENRPEPEKLAALNTALGEAFPHLRLEQHGGQFRWHWADASNRLDRLLWPVTRSAAELLTSSEVSLVRECASERCSWMFVDRSRTHRRRWCDMKTCGNRAKARRHYERRKQRSLDGSH
jgi:predicted RNA-binding Zn ribbon-like protein